MHKYRVFQKTCLLAALVLGTMLTANAQEWKKWGVHTHDHPVTDAQAHEFMKILGWKPTTEGGTDYESTLANLVEPEGVDAGEMLLIEVNPYWRGLYKHPTTKKTTKPGAKVNDEYINAPVWEVAKYGIKDIHKVGDPNKTANGKLFSYSGKLGRFHFVIRRSKAWVTGLSQSMPGMPTIYRWYEEWSMMSPDGDNVGWADFACQDHYQEFEQGVVWYAPHNCSNTLEFNHICSFIKEGTEDYFDGYNATVLFYISDYWDSHNIKGTGEIISKLTPFICLLRTNQDPTQLVKVEGEENKYDITLTFSSTFADASAAIEKDNEHMWVKPEGETPGVAGVREFFEIWRNGERIAIVPADELELKYDETTKTYTYSWTDTNGGNHFGSEEPLGSDYEYEIVSKLYNVDANGNIIDEETAKPIATTQTEKRPAHIPGDEALSLEMDGTTKSTYTPSTTLNGGYNTFTHILNAGVKKPFSYVDGDILELRQALGSATEFTVVAGYQETLTGAGQIADIIASDKWKQMTYQFTKPAGQSEDARYQLVLKHYDTTVEEWVEALSNVVTLSAYRADLAAGTYAHRQGHPSAAFCPADEVYHNEVKFTPNSDGNIRYHVVVCNGDPREVYVITPEMYTKGAEYLLTVQHQAAGINPGEASGTESSKEIFYTCVVFTKDGSSYGSADLPFTFTGAPQELVYYNDPTFGATDRTRTSHHESAWQGEFDVKLLEGNGADADDVDPTKITGAKIYGIFYPTEQDYEAKTNAVEKELCTVDPTEIGLNYTYRTEVYVKGNPKYADDWADLKALYDAGYDYMSDEAKAKWAAICEKMWFDNMPTDIYIEVTFEGTSPTPSPTPDLAAAKAVNRALDNDGSYTKYTNWAELPPPDFSSPIITGIETIDADNAAAPAEYYDMHGRRVTGPAPGQLLIRRQGSTVTKVF